MKPYDEQNVRIRSFEVECRECGTFIPYLVPLGEESVDRVVASSKETWTEKFNSCEACRDDE